MYVKHKMQFTLNLNSANGFYLIDATNETTKSQNLFLAQQFSRLLMAKPIQGIKNV